MRVLGNKIFVRITKENRDSIFTKTIIDNTGNPIKLFVNVPAIDEIDERRSRLFVQTAIVEAVGDKVKGVEVGDMAIIDFMLCNMSQNVVYKDGEDEVFWLNADTKYHEKDEIAYANRKPIYKGQSRDQVVCRKGDYEELSMLLGLIRGDKLIARDPFVFLVHESNIIHKVTLSGISYDETEKIVDREVLAVSERSSIRCGIEKGDTVRLKDVDIFNIEYQGKTIQCVNDVDCMAVVGLESI